MILFPAIDIKNGECVRLKLGDLDDSKTYNKDPLSQAKLFEEYGFEWVHIVDLNAAVTGTSLNGEVIKTIVQNTRLKVQLGGGIKSLEQINYWFSIGVQKLVLGTISVNDVDFVKETIKKFPNKIVLALDTKNELICIDGWKTTTNINVFDLVQEYNEYEVNAILHTDINRDGMLQGLNFEASRKLAHATRIPVILSGGLTSIDEIQDLNKSENMIFKGAIMGKALYEKKIDPLEALKTLNR